MVSAYVYHPKWSLSHFLMNYSTSMHYKLLLIRKAAYVKTSGLRIYVRTCEILFNSDQGEWLWW